MFTTIPFQVGYFYFNKAQRMVDEIINEHKPDYIYCQLIRTSEYVKSYASIPKVLDYMDVFSKGMERRTRTAAVYLKPFLSVEYKRLLKYENMIFDYFNHKTIISEQDKALIQHPRKDEIVVIPNGVDTDYFKPIDCKKEFDLLFNGNMNYPPNVESVEYLIHKIMPHVWKTLPSVRVLISGASPSDRVLALASDRVVVSGWVDNISTNFAKSKILIAPMQISIGLQNKLLEAMAMQLPCITSTLANNALMAKPNEEVLVADAPEQYATYIVELLNDESMAIKIAQRGYQLVIEKYNWQSTTSVLEKLFFKK